MHINRVLVRGLLLALLIGLFSPVCTEAKAETVRVSLPTAFRPDTLNSVTPSPSAPVAFTASRETDTLFAFDPRNGALIGKIEVGDGPQFVRLREDGGRRTLAVSCDGQLSSPQNVIAIVDATNPAHMRIIARALVPVGYEFLLGYATVHFSPDGSMVIAALTELANGTARGALMTFDASDGNFLNQVDIAFAPSSAALANRDGKVIVAISHATGPRGSVTLAEVLPDGTAIVYHRVLLPDNSSMFNVNTVEMSANGRIGYVCSSVAQFLFTFDTETGEILSREYSGAFPTAVHPFRQNGKDHLLVVAETSAAVFIWDMSNPRDPRELGSFYSGAAFIDSPASITSDGKMAFATSSDGDLVLAIDLTTGDATYNEVIGDYPVATAVWQDGTDTYVCVLGAFSDDVNCLQATDRGFRRRGVFAGEAGSVQFGIYQNIALSPSGDYAFIASTGTDELLAIDVAEGSVVGRISVGVSPAQVAVTADSEGRLRVATLGAGDSKVTVVDATTPAAMAVLGSVDIDSGAPFYLQLANMVFSGDGKTLFVAEASLFVVAVSVETMEIVGVIAAGHAPVRIALREAEGKRTLAVLNASPFSTGITLIDATNPRSMKRTAEYTAPEGTIVALNNIPSFSSDGRVVVFGASVTNDMFVVNAGTGQLVASYSGVSPLKPAPYVSGGVGRIAAFGAATVAPKYFRFLKSGSLKLTSQGESLDRSYFIASNTPFVGPTGDIGFVPDYGRRSLLFFDPATGNYTGEIPIEGGPSEMAVDWQNRRAVVINANGPAGDVFIVDLDDAGPITSKASPKGVRSMAMESRGLLTAKSALRTNPRVRYFPMSERRIVGWPAR